LSALSGFMSMTIFTPTSGRLRLAASGLLLSVLGLPVAGSTGSVSETMWPHRAPPQLAMAILALPSSVIQLPRGSPAAAGVAAATPRMANVASASLLFMFMSPFETGPPA
jgi:hypothetical protein